MSLEPSRVPSVIAETDELLVIDKPAGLIVHSDGRTEEPSVAEWILEKYPALARVGEPWISPQGESVALPGIVHRLDRTTSGILLIAKTPEAYAYVKGEFKARRVEKTYRACVYGHMEENVGRIVAEIMRSKEVPRRWYARSCDENDNRAAITNWSVLQRLTAEGGEAASYLELKPETGRTHQIRVHLASIGHPVLSDHLYAPERPRLLNFTRLALHAYQISLTLGGIKQTFTAPLPADFEAASLNTHDEAHPRFIRTTYADTRATLDCALPGAIIA
ncbi:MAG: RluA family pseudouridine synthase [Patescibacteria group bacterium]